jgi:thiamine biosynthesis lipoprotein
MQLHRFLFRAMAAENELQLWADDASLAGRAADAAMGDVLRIEAKYSRYRDDSMVTRINRAAGRQAVAIDGETAALLAYADRCHALSDGLFDITSGVLRRIWDFKRTPPALPSPADIAQTLALIDWASVEWSEHSIRLPVPRMEIDFGGIGKEYAADRAATICQEHGIAHGLVNLAGDIRILGPNPDGTPWRIGIRQPRPYANEGVAAIAGIDVSSGAIATSGDYERYLEVDNRRYCHIMNPRTGWPVSHWRSITVLAPLCVVAGACATIAMLFESRAAAFLETQSVHWLGISTDGASFGAGAGAADTPHPQAVQTTGA